MYGRESEWNMPLHFAFEGNFAPRQRFASLTDGDTAEHQRIMGIATSEGVVDAGRAAADDAERR